MKIFIFVFALAAAAVVFSSCSSEPKSVYGRAVKLSQQQRYSEAVEFFKKELAAHDDEFEVAYDIAQTYLKMGDMTNALEYLNVTVRMHTIHYPAFYNMAVLYYNQGKYRDSYNAILRSRGKDAEKLLRELYYRSKKPDGFENPDDSVCLIDSPATSPASIVELVFIPPTIKHKESIRMNITAGKSISSGMLRDFLDVNRDTIEGCYDKSLRKNRSLGGAVSLSFNVAGDGKITGLKTDKKTPLDDMIESCVKEAVEKMELPQENINRTPADKFDFKYSDFSKSS